MEEEALEKNPDALVLTQDEGRGRMGLERQS